MIHFLALDGNPRLTEQHKEPARLTRRAYFLKRGRQIQAR